jgi:hypothetical protein
MATWTQTAKPIVGLKPVLGEIKVARMLIWNRIAVLTINGAPSTQNKPQGHFWG